MPYTEFCTDECSDFIKPDKTAISLRFHVDTIEVIRRAAKEKGVSFSQYVRDAALARAETDISR